MDKKAVTVKRFRYISLALITTCVLITCLSMPFGNLDEIWVYNVSRSITMGYIPYSNIRMVFMPLFSYLLAIPLLLGRYLIVYRLTECAFLSLLFILLYTNIARVTNDYYALPATLLFIRFNEFATYNHLMMLFAVLAYMYLLKEYSFRRNFFIGLFAALAALSRQTSGGIFLVALLICLLIIHIRDGHPSRILSWIAGAFVPCLIFLIYLLATDSFVAFWDCCLFSLFGFGKGNSIILTSSAGFIVIILTGIGIDIFFLFRKYSRDILFHFLTLLCLTITAVPIADPIHLIMSAMFSLIPITMLIKSVGNLYLKRYMSYLSSVFICAFVIIMAALNFASTEFSDSYKELRFIPLSGIEEGYHDLAELKAEYKASGKNVHVFSAASAIISIMGDEADPPYDLFLTGNLGTKDPVSYAEELCSSADNIIIIHGNYNEENWENPEGILEYVETKCTQIGSYGSYIFYQPNV